MRIHTSALSQGCPVGSRALPASEKSRATSPDAVTLAFTEIALPPLLVTSFTIVAAAEVGRVAQRQREKVEALFVKVKNHIGLRHLRLRRLNATLDTFSLQKEIDNIGKR